MNATASSAREGSSILSATICFGLAVAAELYALAIFNELGMASPPEYRDSLWANLFGVSIFVLFIALPSALFFGGLLLLIERKSSKPSGLVNWLVAGLMALAPMAGLLWYIDGAFDMLEFDPQPPYAWVNIRPALMMLSHGPMAALAAWFLRRARSIT